ncbi:MAG: hypothetical protein ABI193_19670 [Minicystis sp.]
MVVIFPEGTRSSPRRREERIARFVSAGQPELAEQARKLEYTLMPRAAGPLALMEAAPHSDVLFLAHRGFEGLRDLRSLFDASLRGRKIQLRIWRVAAAEIPGDPDGRRDWLYHQWREVDRFAGPS